jgi:hypothetical protein
MRSVTRLIEQIRRQTENEEVSDFIGIKDEEFIQYINDAQYNLQAQIVHQHPRVFIDEAIIQTVSGQERYDLPSNCFLGNKVHNVEYSPTGNDEDYYTLRQTTMKSRSSGVDADPSQYIRVAGQILLTPQPTSGGKIRINYVKRLRELDKRKAQVSTQATVDSQNDFVLELNNTSFDTNIEDLRLHDFICIVDKEGNNLVKNIEIDLDITNTNSSQITCRAHTLDTGESATIPVGSYIVGGKDTTTHSELGIEVERYLIAYCAWKILKRDSSVDSAEAMQELNLMAQEIVKSYALITDDVQLIPDINSRDDWSI